MENKFKGIKQKVADRFDLPQEIIANLPKVTMIGNSEIIIENHKGILSFDNNKIKIRTTLETLVIDGESIEILFIGGNTITISGVFKALNYEGGE